MMHPPMRTTITLEPDVEARLRAAMSDRGVGFKAAVNDALRRGLGIGDATDYRLTPTRMGAPALPLDAALRVAANLEDEEIARKLMLRK